MEQNTMALEKKVGLYSCVFTIYFRQHIRKRKKSWWRPDTLC